MAAALVAGDVHRGVGGADDLLWAAFVVWRYVGDSHTGAQPDSSLFDDHRFGQRQVDGIGDVVDEVLIHSLENCDELCTDDPTQQMGLGKAVT